MNIRRNRKGFTLIELLVVIAIIAILASIAIPVYSGITNKHKLTVAKGKAENIWKNAELINRDIKFGTIKIPTNYATTLAAINARSDSATQISAVITAAQWPSKTVEGNYISVDANNLITDVYIIYGGQKVRWNSTGYVG